MARALTPVTAEEFEEAEALGGVVERVGGLRYRFENLAVGPAIVETSDERAGHRIAAPLAFAIGAGVRDRSFAAIQGAFLWFAPLEVVTVFERGVPVGRRSALAPGHMISPGSRFETPITPDCLGCHTDASLPRPFPANLVPDADVFEPRGLSCGACHADAETHADWQERDLAGEEPEGVDPLQRDLSRIEALSICASCHLQGDARIPLDGGGLGRRSPGGDLLERHAVFVAADSNRGVGFVSQVERLVLSRCFLGSDRLTCETCHDPHRALQEPGERERTRGACERCHPRGRGPSTDCPRSSPSQARDRDCVDCHMPETEVFDIADVRVHDHFIRARPEPASDPTGDPRPRILEAPDGRWRRFVWPGEEEPPGMDDPGLWMAALAQARIGDAAFARLEAGMGPISRRIPIVQHLAGVLLDEWGRPREAESHYRAALALDPDLSESAINLGLLLGKTGRRSEGIALLDRVLEAHPYAVGALRNRATLRLEEGDLAGFGADLELAFSLQPREELARALATLSERAGKIREARSWEQRADAIAVR